MNFLKLDWCLEKQKEMFISVSKWKNMQENK